MHHCVLINCRHMLFRATCMRGTNLTFGLARGTIRPFLPDVQSPGIYRVLSISTSAELHEEYKSAAVHHDQQFYTVRSSPAWKLPKYSCMTSVSLRMIPGAPTTTISVNINSSVELLGVLGATNKADPGNTEKVWTSRLWRGLYARPGHPRSISCRCCHYPPAVC